VLVYVLYENMNMTVIGVYSTLEAAWQVAIDSYNERYPNEPVAFEKDFELRQFTLDAAPKEIP
jgi:hypothetical protein